MKKFLLFLPLIVVVSCEMFKIPSEVGVPTWDTHLYVKVLQKNIKVADELSDNDSLFTMVDERVKLEKKTAETTIQLKIPEIDQSSSSTAKVGHIELSNLGNSSISFNLMTINDKATSPLIKLPVDFGSDFSRAQISKGRMVLKFFNGATDVTSRLSIGDPTNRFKLITKKWDDTTPDTMRFGNDGIYAMSLNDETTWKVLKATGLTIEGKLKNTSGSDVNVDKLILAIEADPNDNKLLASRAELPANSSSFANKSFVYTSKASLGEDYLVYQADIDSGQMVFDKSETFGGIEIKDIVVSSSDLYSSSGATLLDTLFQTSSDSIVSLNGYRLGSGTQLDSLNFSYVIEYGKDTSASTIAVNYDDTVAITVGFFSKFSQVTAKVINSNAFSLDSSSSTMELGDDLPKFKNKNGVKKEIGFADSSYAEFVANFPITATTLTEFLEYRVVMSAYDGGVVKKEIVDTIKANAGTTRTHRDTSKITGLEELINISPDSIVTKIVPAFKSTNEVLTFYAGDANLTTILHSYLAINTTNTTNFPDSMAYYEPEDSITRQDNALTVAQVNSAKNTILWLKYINTTNASFGGEMLFAKDSQTIVKNSYNTAPNTANFRRVEIEILEVTDSNYVDIKLADLTKDDLLVMAGDENEKFYSFIILKVKGNGKALGGEIDIHGYLDLDITVDSEVVED